MTLSLTNDALQLTGFPVSLGAPSYTDEGSATYAKNGRTITAHELHVDTGPRTKRCFVLAPPVYRMARPMLGVAYPGSNGEGDGAEDLLSGNVLNQNEWPLQLVADHDIFMVAIDLPNFGPMPAYGEFPPDMLGPLSDNVHAIQAARHYIENELLPESGARFSRLEPQMFVGGLSWGAYMTSVTAAACTDFRWAYVGSQCTSRLHDPRTHFNPTEWGTAGYDYDDMAIAASEWCQIRWQFGGDNTGGNGNDYLYAPFQDPDPEEPTVVHDLLGTVPNANYMLANMIANGSGNITTRINQTLDHEIDVDDLKGWFKPFQPNPFRRWRAL